MLLLRDPAQSGFGFSLGEQAEPGGSGGLGGIGVNAVKPDGVAALSDVRPGDRLLEVNGVSTRGMSCADLLPLFKTDILELVLLPAPAPGP